MMGHVVDRWTVPDPASPQGRRVRGPRHGRGKRWLARWTEPDGSVRSRAFATKDEASAHQAAVDLEVRGSTYLRATKTTFAEYAEQWLTHQVHHRPGTAAAAASKLRLHAYPALGHLLLPSITRAHVQEVVASATTLGPDARRVLYVYVRAVLASAVDDRLIAASPCVRIKLPKGFHERIVPLTVEEVAQRAAGVPPHLEGMVWLGAGTGLRPGELRGLTVDRVVGDVVRVDRQLVSAIAGRVVFGPLKTEASTRSVRLAPVTQAGLVRHLEAYPPGRAGLVFTGARGAPVGRSALAYAWSMATAGGPGAPRSGWHELRHHHASLLIAAGMSPRAVADRLGHANPAETLATYAHLWGSDEERIVAAVEAAYEGIS